MVQNVKGIHHITAIVGNPQRNLEFYARVLGLRFVKRTVNFDDPGTYHFYFGNEQGSPGTIMTFFPWDGAMRGKIGAGQVGVTSFVVPLGALGFWEKRLKQYGVVVKKLERFQEEFLRFQDPHGLQLEIVSRESGQMSEWTFENITKEKAIKGFGGAIIYSKDPEKSGELLTKVMGLERLGEEGPFVRYMSTGDIGNIIDIDLSVKNTGSLGVGTVHHIAWRAKDDDDQKSWQETLGKVGLYTTEVKDRQYFKAIYFREPGQLLYEIATDPPGFAIDESEDQLGMELKLPPWLEPHREKIEDTVAAITVPNP